MAPVRFPAGVNGPEKVVNGPRAPPEVLLPTGPGAVRSQARLRRETLIALALRWLAAPCTTTSNSPSP